MSVRKPRFVRMTVPTHGTRKPSYFVLHTTEGGGTVESLCDFFCRGELGVNFIVEPEGRAGFNGALASETWHVQQHNSDCIGMEQIGYTALSREDWLRATPKVTFEHGHRVVHPARLRQVYKAAWIVAWACTELGIPIVAAGSDKTGRRFIHPGVTQHKWVPDNDHDDCGSGYPFDKVLELAQRWQKTGGPSLRTRVYIKTGRLAP